MNLNTFGREWRKKVSDNNEIAQFKKMMNKILDDIQEKDIRNKNNSRLTPEKINTMLRLIAKIEINLSLLLYETEHLGGFCHYYPEQCLTQLGIMNSILEAELQKDKESV